MALCIIASQGLGWLYGRNIPYSYYYQFPEDKWERRMNHFQQQGIQALSDLRFWMVDRGLKGRRLLFDPDSQPTAEDAFRLRKPPDLCVAIINQDQDSRYIEQTVGTLLSRMTKSLEARISITVYDVADRNDPGGRLAEEVEGSASSSQQAKDKDSKTFLRGKRSYWRVARPPTVKQNSRLFRTPLVGDVVREESLRYPPHLRPETFLSAGPAILDLIDHIQVLKALYARGCPFGLVLNEAMVAAEGWAGRLMDLLDLEAGDHPNWIVVRLFTSLRDYRLRWWIPSEWFWLLALASIITLLTWLLTCGIFYLLFARGTIDSPGGLVWYQELKTMSLPVIVLLVLNYFILFLLLGKATMIPVGGPGLRRLDVTGPSLAYANLYPRQVLLEYATLLEERVRGARRAGALIDIPHWDRYLWELREQLEARDMERWQMLRYAPSLFQHAGRRALTDSINSITVAHDFPDDDQVIMFDQKTFLEL